MLRRLTLPALMAMFALCLMTLACSDPTRSMPPEGSLLDAHHTRVTCIDVGKGDCILVQNGSSAVLIDTGYQATAGEVLSCLADQGVARLDALVLTHYDKDHVGGFSAIAGSLDVDAVYLPGYVGSDKHYETTVAVVDELGVPAQPVTKKVSLTLGEAQLVIYPSDVAYVPGTRGEEGNDNDASLVVALTCADDSYLFAGDLEEDGVDAFLRSAYGHFDVVKMPHHGEGDKNTSAFVESVQPRIALITDSSKDPADKKTLKLLKKREVDVYRTSTDGTIVVESEGTGSYEVSTQGD